MAQITKLPKPSPKGEPPKSSAAVNNLERTPHGGKDKVQFNIFTETRIDFQTYATIHTKGNASKLFEIVWAFYKQHHP
jgi:hypothetical protein